MESEETNTINIDINDVDEQFFRDQIEAFQKININDDELYVFNSNNVSDEEKETLKTILCCCNTKFFLNKNNIDYNNAENLSNAVSVLQDKLVTDAVSLKLIAQGNNATQINMIDSREHTIDRKKKIISGLFFKDELANSYYVNFNGYNYVKYFVNVSMARQIGYARQLQKGNQLHIMHGEFIIGVHAKGTYIIISKNQIKNSTANEIIIDICYDYKNNDAPNIRVGGGSAFRITLTQKEGKYTLNSIKKGNMKEDEVDDTSLKEVQTLDIQGIIDNEEQGKSLRETLAEEPELCKVLQEAKVISQEQYQSIINPTIKKQINGKSFIISKKLLEAESSQSQGESMQDDNYNNSQNNPNTERLQSSKIQSNGKSNGNNTSQQLPDSKDRDISECPPDINVNTADVKHNYNFFCLKDTWIGKNKTTGKYGCCGCDCC